MKNVAEVVEKYGVDIVSKMIAILESQGSRNLKNKINQQLYEDIASVTLEIKMPSYGYYASEGRAAGRFPPIAPIRAWAVQRGMDEAAAYPIARKIASQGTKESASHFLKEFRISTEFEKAVLDAYALDVKEILRDYIKDKENIDVEEN